MIPVQECRSVEPVSVKGNGQCRERANHVTTSIVFDIETGPLPQDILAGLFEPYVPMEFDPSSVKYGNTKDEGKRAAKLEEVRGKHLETELAKAFAKEQEFFGKAALNADTGQVLAIGYYWPGEDDEMIVGNDLTDEAGLLINFWSIATEAVKGRAAMVGHNITGFDLPFMVRRSWLLGVNVPAAVFGGSGGPALSLNTRYFSDSFIDTQRRWQLSTGDYISLDRLSRAMGVGRKTGDGADFARLWAADRAAAVEYLRNDLRLTWSVARRMGVQ